MVVRAGGGRRGRDYSQQVCQLDNLLEDDITSAFERKETDTDFVYGHFRSTWLIQFIVFKCKSLI